MSAPRGYVIWEGASPFDGAPIAMIVTTHSANRKTGDMVQTWILRTDVPPLEALRTNGDASICGACPLRGAMVDGTRVGRACYVNVGQAPNSVWRTYTRGGYVRMDAARVGEIIAGRGVRLGAYGDPAMVPLSVLRDLVAHASVWTGYTHQWRTVDSAYASLLMASTESDADMADATARGYRFFHVVADGAPAPSRTVECAATRERNPLQCIDCGMCAGTRNGTASGAVSVVITAHGSGAKYVGK